LILGAFLGAGRLLNGALAPLHRTPWQKPPSVLVAGDSHAVRGVDPALLQDARNVGELSQPLAITYYLIKYLFDTAPGIRTVVVTFGPHNIATSRDQALLGDQGHEHMSLYWGIVPWRRLDGMPLSPLEYAASEFRIWWVPNFHLASDALSRDGTPREHPYMGGYEAHADGYPPSPVTEVIERHYPAADRASPISETQISYLDSILVWAAREDVELVLLNTPLHPEYHEAVPEVVSEKFDDVWAEAVSRNGVRGLDLSRLGLPSDAYFDSDHVSARGAEVVTRLLGEFLDPH